MGLHLFEQCTDLRVARTKLLVHLLMSTPLLEMSTSGEPQSEKEITARMLKEPLDQKRHESSNKDLKKRYHIVQTIIDTRTKLEAYEMGGIGTSFDHFQFTKSLN